MGLFTVKDRTGSFNTVAPDLKIDTGGHVIVGEKSPWDCSLSRIVQAHLILWLQI